MECPSLSDVRAIWEEDVPSVDGMRCSPLRDIYVSDTNAAEWRLAGEAVRANGWPSSYLRDGAAAPIPTDLAEPFASLTEEAGLLLWTIRIAPSFTINCNFFDETEIEFDFQPDEITEEQDFRALCEFMRTIGRALGKEVGVGFEHSGGPARLPRDMHYDPAIDAVVLDRSPHRSGNI